MRWRRHNPFDASQVEQESLEGRARGRKYLLHRVLVPRVLEHLREHFYVLSDPEVTHTADDDLAPWVLVNPGFGYYEVALGISAQEPPVAWASYGPREDLSEWADEEGVAWQQYAENPSNWPVVRVEGDWALRKLPGEVERIIREVGGYRKKGRLVDPRGMTVERAQTDPVEDLVAWWRWNDPHSTFEDEHHPPGEGPTDEDIREETIRALEG